MPSVSEFLSRARSVIGKGIRYKLGGGGMNPRAASPANISNECDCSGFVCWALGLSRQTDHPLYVRFNNGWINTDAMVYDARATTGFFSEIAEPKVGAIVVYGSRPPSRKVGHVGIVTAVQRIAGVVTATKVLHCSHGNHTRKRDAICETEPTVFRKPDTVVAWYEGIDLPA